RFRAGRRARQDAAWTQQRVLMHLLRRASATRFGRDHGFGSMADVKAFQAAVPLRRYEEFWTGYWQPAFPELVDISWPGRIPLFAESSGTSSGATKFIPVTWEMVRSNRQAGLDLLVHHVQSRPESRIFAGRNLLIG